MKMKFFLSLIMIAVLSACSSPQPESEAQAPMGGVVVTVKNTGLVFKKGTTFSFSEAYSQVYEDPRYDDKKMGELLREGIASVFEQKGYEFVESDGQYEVAYVIATSQSLSDIEVSERFGVNPGMIGQSSDPTEYDKGTIVVDVQDPGAKVSVWRSALQGYASFEMPDDARRQRMEIFMQRLFASFPAGQ